MNPNAVPKGNHKNWINEKHKAKDHPHFFLEKIPILINIDKIILNIRYGFNKTSDESLLEIKI